MFDSYQVYTQANELVHSCGTRDTLQIARDLNIWIYYLSEGTDLLGMYTFRWNHRIMLLNPDMDEIHTRMVAGHEIGHDQRHRSLAKVGGMKEFTLFNMKNRTEYEANAFAAHLLLDDDDVFSLSREGYDVSAIASALKVNINLVLIKIQEMMRLGYDFRLPMNPDSTFFRNIKGSSFGFETKI